MGEAVERRQMGRGTMVELGGGVSGWEFGGLNGGGWEVPVGRIWVWGRKIWDVLEDVLAEGPC